jgi:hypothetical protein
MLALVLPCWQLIVSFGYRNIDVPLLGSISFWKLLAVACIGIGYGAWRRLQLAGILLAACLMAVVIEPAFGLFFADVIFFGLGVFLWTGTIFGYAFAPGQQVTIVTGLAPARQNFQSFMVFAFWLNLVTFALGKAGPLLPLWFIMTMLSAVFIMIPGALATSGRSGFLVMFRITTAAFVISLGLGVIMAFQAMGLLGSWEELGRTSRAFLWEATDLTTYYLPWAVAILSALSLKKLVQKWGNTPFTIFVNTLGDLFFASIPLVLLFWFFGERGVMGKVWRYALPHIMFPLHMPVIYTPNQAILVVLIGISMLLVLYKGLRGDATKLSWDRVWMIIFVMWLGIFGGKELFYRMG